MAQKRNLAAHLLAVLACLAFCACAFGQKQSAKPSAATTPPSSPAPAPPAAAPSLLDRPAQPAKVNLSSGKLAVQADNSSLSDILHQVSRASGMKIEGLVIGSSRDQRVFGSYGPGAPRDVLSELLNGTGYNVMMLGATPSGAPRELALTSPSPAGAPGAQPQPPASQNGDNDDSGDNAQPTQYPEEQNLTPPPGPPQMRRTPQQMLQELQRIRQQQQQDQQQNQQDQQPN